MTRALITGVNGQDGSYLAELLLARGYEVHGLIRRSSMERLNDLPNMKNLLEDVKIHACSLEDHPTLYKLIQMLKPDECYHLAASSFVNYDFAEEASVIAVNFNATHYLLSCIRDLVPYCRFYFAGSSEMFGDVSHYPQDEHTPFNPRSIYGIAKLSSFYIVKKYREHYGLYCCTGLTYNHESPRRGRTFVTRKITSGLAKIISGADEKLYLGNLDAVRDWGYAPEYVEAMWMMLHNPRGPQDYVIATGIPHSVRDFLQLAFGTVGLDYQHYVESCVQFFRPAEVVPLLGCATAITRDLGWQPKKNFADLVSEMVRYDIACAGGECE